MNECTISGTISHVIYQNEENGYTVLRLVTSDGEAVTAVDLFGPPGGDSLDLGQLSRILLQHHQAVGPEALDDGGDTAG